MFGATVSVGAAPVLRSVLAPATNRAVSAASGSGLVPAAVEVAPEGIGAVGAGFVVVGGAEGVVVGQGGSGVIGVEGVEPEGAVRRGEQSAGGTAQHGCLW